MASHSMRDCQPRRSGCAESPDAWAGITDNVIQKVTSREWITRSFPGAETPVLWGRCRPRDEIEHARPRGIGIADAREMRGVRDEPCEQRVVNHPESRYPLYGDG